MRFFKQGERAFAASGAGDAARDIPRRDIPRPDVEQASGLPALYRGVRGDPAEAVMDADFVEADPDDAAFIDPSHLAGRADFASAAGGPGRGRQGASDAPRGQQEAAGGPDDPAGVSGGQRRPAEDLGEVLVAEGLLSRSQLEFAKRVVADLTQQGERARLREELVQCGFITPTALAEVLRRRGIEQDIVDEAASLQRILPAELRRRLGVRILRIEGQRLDLAAQRILNDADKALILRFAAGAGHLVSEVRAVAVDRRELHQTLSRQSTLSDQALESAIFAISEDTYGARVRETMTALLVEALEDGASDVYFSVSDDARSSMVRRRIDGSVRLRMLVPPATLRRVATVLKDAAGIDVGDPRPHDARMSFDYQNRKVDVRISTLPMSGGEQITLRLLDPGTIRGLEAVWERFPEVGRRCDLFSRSAGKFASIFLVTGPVGSGKTSTLRAMALAMPREQLKVMSSEDPIEFKLPYVVQTQVDEGRGLGFAEILRTQLRQDLDVAIVGEIRDRATMQACLRTCESGVNVLSTLHADDAPQSIQRAMALLPDAEKESAGYIFGRYLSGIVNQQLVPTLCQSCKIEREVASIRSDWAAALIENSGFLDDDIVFEANPEGCVTCGRTGFHRRTLVPDALFVPDQARGVFMSAVASSDYEAIYAMPELARYTRENSLIGLLRAGAYDLRSYGALLERKMLDDFR